MDCEICSLFVFFFRRLVLFFGVEWSESQRKKNIDFCHQLRWDGTCFRIWTLPKKQGVRVWVLFQFPKNDLSKFVGSVTRHLNDAVSANSTPPKTNNDPKHELKCWFPIAVSLFHASIVSCKPLVFLGFLSFKHLQHVEVSTIPFPLTWCNLVLVGNFDQLFLPKDPYGGTKKQRPIPVPPMMESPISEVSEGYHIDGFRCDAISSMYLSVVVFFFKETGQSLEVWRGGGVDSAFISWYIHSQRFFFGGVSKWKGPRWFRIAREIYVVNQLQVECHTDHLE